MGGTIPASTRGGGQVSNFPDVCKVPAPPAPFAPVPFPNMMQDMQFGNVVDVRAANGNQGAKIAQSMAIRNVQDKMGLKVSSATQAAMVGRSAVPRSHGDESGTLKGMVSQKHMGPMSPKMGSSKVMINGGSAFNPMAGTDKVDFTSSRTAEGE